MTSIWSRPPTPSDNDRTCNMLWICWSQLTWQRFRICLMIKVLKSVYGIEHPIRSNKIIQCIPGVLVDDCVEMDIEMTRNPCEKNLLQMRAVILEDELYQAAWYKIDGLFHKRLIRNLIFAWQDSNKRHTITYLGRRHSIPRDWAMFAILIGILVCDKSFIQTQLLKMINRHGKIWINDMTICKGGEIKIATHPWKGSPIRGLLVCGPRKITQ